ncbi:hypothetical protein [Thermomonospora cellulosilytica]|uniref:Uncharacterized protein n=1 Tax=Thermomonospora cellulosilytica TaxID=1411118 RepID=A0A7W3N0B2_9ACTN|nr:hypothetical protein [Thermomonospora cellulosilytica]MBA9005187.1 hypothetical protein [Thermomonospora cellulosilytica]
MNDPGEPPAAPSGPAVVGWWRRRWVWWTAGAVGTVLALVLLVLLLWPATTWWVEHVDGVDLDGQGAPTGKERQEVLDKARGRITAVATGILAAVAIYYTAANARSARQTAHAAQDNVQAALRASEVAEAAQLRTFQLTQEGLRQSEEAQRRTHELTERGQVTDRFTAAVAQLGEASTG